MGYIQDVDIKSEAELISAGADKTSLPNTSKMFISHAQVQEIVDAAIENNKLFTMKMMASQAAPGAGYLRLFPGLDKQLYSVDELDVIRSIGGGGSGGGKPSGKAASATVTPTIYVIGADGVATPGMTFKNTELLKAITILK